MSQWGPEHDRPINYVPTQPPEPAHEMWLASDGHVHVVHRAYIEAGLNEAAEHCADEADALVANWTVMGAYANDPEARAHIDHRLPGLDDAGRWRCDRGQWHGIDDTCDCNTEER